MSGSNDQVRPGTGDAEIPDESTQQLPSPQTQSSRWRRPGGRRITREPKYRSRRRRITYWVIGVIAFATLAYAGFYGYIFYKVEHNIKHSAAISGLTKTPTGDGMDLLVMGLDSRLDENGQRLPDDVYRALHAGHNSNVLMYVHVADDGSRAVEVTIPRDDWVVIPGCANDARLRYFVGSGCHGKIKSAYGWAFAAAQQQGKSFQEAKDIARAEEVKTVERFLNVKISSFVEVTMGAFYQIAEQVQPITVCVKENTTDTYSGANFKAGVQQLSAKQAVAFVRQRRDLHERYSFTDLDRGRRQQAFIVSLLTQLKSAGTLLNPLTLNNIVDVATNNVVISSGLDPTTLASLASKLSGGNLHFYTLPVVKFGVENGEDVNIVNVPRIQAIVKGLLNAAPDAALPSGAGYTVNTINASGDSQAARRELTSLAQHGYKSGTTTDSQPSVATSTLTFNPSDRAAAGVLAKRLGGTITLVASTTAKSHDLTLTIGTTLAKTIATTPTSVPTAVSATGGGTNGPAITQLTDLASGSIPCVK
jgi:LCP family protein required for cell wall assembly